jgi:hypothetical protein
LEIPFDESIVGRLAGPAELKLYALLMCPGVKRPGDELAAVIAFKYSAIRSGGLISQPRPVIVSICRTWCEFRRYRIFFTATQKLFQSFATLTTQDVIDEHDVIVCISDRGQFAVA